ncbi:MAG: sterol carrier protein [archaeon]|nr:sterol carrier protein [archaeon]
MSEKESVPFPSKKWAEGYKKKLNESQEYADAAKTWEGDIFILIEPDGGATPIQIGANLGLQHGVCTGIEFWVQGQEKPKHDYHMSGPEKNWLLLKDGLLDPIKGMMTGKFKMVGNMSEVMRHVKAAALLVSILTTFSLELPKVEPYDPNADEIFLYDDAGVKTGYLDNRKTPPEFELYF